MVEHLSPGRLASVDRTAAETEHLASCARCRSHQLRVLDFQGSDEAGPSAPGSDFSVDSGAPAPPPAEYLAPGTCLDRYVIEGVLGEGGMAVVYRARHAQLGSAFAIKVLTIPSRSVRERLLTEGRVQAKLRSRNIVPVTDVIDVYGAPGLVMELVEGPTLAELLRDEGRLPLDRVDALARGILSGTAVAHKAGLIHRDLKPANILLARTDDGLVPMITDFGLAKLLDAADGPDIQHTRSGTTLGTPQYMSPEQIRSARSVDQRSDVFSLGAILYELVTGVAAFAGADLLVIYGAITEGRYRPIRELAPEAPDRMVTAIEAALRVDREARVQDVEALAALWRGGVAADSSVEQTSFGGGRARGDERPGGAPAGARAEPPGNRVLLAAVAASVLLSGAVAGLVVWVARPAAAPTDALGGAPVDALECVPLVGSYMPLAVGDWWSYQMRDPSTERLSPKEKKITVDRQGDVGGLHAGLQAFRIFREDSDGTGYRWIGKTGDSVSWLHDDWMGQDGAVTKSQYYKPARARVDDGCAHRTLGARWTEEYDQIGVDPATGAVTKTAHVVNAWSVEATDEQVTVPAGTFSCIRLRRLNNQNPEARSDQTFWFAAGVGKVKEDSPPKEYEELAAYHLEPPPLGTP